MRKSLLVAGLAVISMSVLGMNNRDIDRGNYSGAHLREITNLSNTEASTSSRKRPIDDSDPQRSAQRRRISNSSDQIQISSDVAKKIDDYVEKYKDCNNTSSYKNIIKEVLIKILTEPNKTITEIAKKYEINCKLVQSWVRRANLSSERKELVNSYRDLKLRLAKAILEYPEKGLEKAAHDNNINRGYLSNGLRKLSDDGKIITKRDQKEKDWRQKKLNLMQAYYESKDLEDLCKIFNGNEKDTKRALGDLVYITLSNEEEKELLTEYSGLIKDHREALLTLKGRIDKWGVNEVKDYLVAYIARKLKIEIEKDPNIEESNWWSKKFDPDSKGGDWWHRESELKYKTEGEVPEETKEDMVVVYNEGHLTRKGIAKLYKTKKSIVSNVFAHKTTNNLIDRKNGWGDLKEVTLDLLTKSPNEVQIKHGYSDRTISDRLVVIDHWRKLSNDQKNAFKKAMKTNKMPDLSDIEDSRVKRDRFINDNFEKYSFALTSTNDEIIERYYKNIKRKETRAQDLRQKVKIWTILAEHELAKQEVDLITAVKNGDLEKVKDLIKKQTNINCKDKYSQTPLMWATTVGNENIVRYLIEHGADLSHKDENNETALTIARNFGHGEIVDILREAREINLIKAVKDGNLEKVKDLIKKQTNINCKDKYSQTPLMWAAVTGNENIVRYLIEHGADLSHKDGNNETALTIARNFGHREIVNILKGKERAED
jgi:transposase-like protein